MKRSDLPSDLPWLVLFIVAVAACFLLLLMAPRIAAAAPEGTAPTVSAQPVAAPAPTPAPSQVDYGQIAKIIGGMLLFAVGGQAGIDQLRKRSADKVKGWASKLLSYAAHEARVLGLDIQKGLAKGDGAAHAVLAKLDSFVEREGQKLPPGQLRDDALRAAHKELHQAQLYADQAAHVATAELAKAAASFEAVLPELKKKIDSFPKGTMPLKAATASGEVQS